MKDLLCFHAFEHVYGIPLHLLQEVFEEQQVTPVPLLNPLLIGLCNHNGILYPVLSFARLCQRDIPDRRTCMLRLQVGTYQLLLRMNDIPFIVHEAEILNEVPYEGGSEQLIIDTICQNKDTLIYILDMEQIIEHISQQILDPAICNHPKG